MLKTGWLDTDGRLYECGEYQHLSVASQLQEKHDYPPLRRDGVLLPADEILLAHGYVYLSYSHSILFSPEWRIAWDYNHHLTSSQQSFLEPYFEEKNINSFSKEHWISDTAN